MKLVLLIFSITFLLSSVSAQLRISEDKRHLTTADGRPFFWLGDTAWELFHRLDRDEASEYLENRSQKGFTVIQAVILAELDGLTAPNAYGHLPLHDRDPARPVEEYFTHVDFIINKAASLGLVVALLPSWGDKWNKKWGVGPEVFTPANARAFGQFVGKRYRDKPVVWVMGGDRDIENPEDAEIIRSMARGIESGDGGKNLISFHPQGGKSSSDFFPNEDWLDFHMSQTGHSSLSKNYQYNEKHRRLNPLKPHLDAEPRYEDHPNQFKPAEFGWMDDFDARQTAYWSMLSGAFGHTYGNHNIWQMYAPGRKPVSWARTHWKVALEHPGAWQMGIMRRFFEKRNWHQLQPDQGIIASENPETPAYVVAAISRDHDFLIAYLPYGNKVTINTGKLKQKELKASWFNPRDGYTTEIGRFENTGSKEFQPHSEGRGSDWILLVEVDT